MHSIYIHMCTGETRLLQWRKPKNSALLSTSTHKHDDSKRNYCALLGTRTNSNNDNRSTGAGMDKLALLLAVTIVAFIIIQLLASVTMIATMVLIIMI